MRGPVDNSVDNLLFPVDNFVGTPVFLMERSLIFSIMARFCPRPEL